MAIADEIKKRYGNILDQYDTKKYNPFTILDSTGGTNHNIVDLNSISEGGVDDLMRQYGGLEQLRDRKSYLQAGRELKEGNEKEEAVNKDTALKQEIEKALGANIDKLYNNAADFAGSAIERQFAPTRAKAMSEEAALGRLGSPVSAYTTGRLNDAQANALGDTVRGLATQRAAGETDLAKYLQTVMAGERRAGEAGQQFQQNFDLGKNQFQAKLNELGADRESKRYLSGLTGDDSGGGDMLAGGISGGISGAQAGSAAGPWGALIGGVAGAGLGAYGESRRKR